MKGYLKENLQFLIIVAIWTIAGIFFWQSLLLIIPVTLILFMKQDMYVEVFLGFWFILILSDSFLPQLEFAKQFKVIYIMLLSAIVFVRRNEIVQGRNQILTFFIPYFVLAFAMIARSPVPEVSFQKTLSYFLLFLLVPSLVNYFIVRDEKKFYRKLVYFGTFLLFAGLVFKYTGAEWVYLAGRFRGILGNPNGLGLFSTLVFVMFLVTSYIRPDTFTRNEKMFIIVIILWNVILCQSRTSLFTIILFVTFSRLYKVSPLIGFAILIASLGAYQTLFLYLPEIISALGLEEYMRLETLESGSGRYIAWNFAWENIQEHMIFGKGFSYTEFIFKENYYKLSRLGHEGNAHNSYLTIWLDTGIMGLLTFIVPFVALILQAAKKTAVAMPFMFAIIFSTYFESWLTASLNPFTIVFLVVLSIITASNRKEETERETLNPSELAT